MLPPLVEKRRPNKFKLIGDSELAEETDRLDWYARFRQPRRLRRIDEQKREPRGKTQTGHRGITPVLREMGEPGLFGVFVHERYAPELRPRLWGRPLRQQNGVAILRSPVACTRRRAL